jgi:hypothetical protein
MLTRAYVGVVLAGSAVLLAGCGGGAAPEPKNPPPDKKAESIPAPQAKNKPPDKKAESAPAGPRSVTLHVKGMTQRLGLT